MSDKKKFDADEACPVAEHLLKLLRPFCERIEIAGSLRRMKDRVGDIELLFVPKMAARQTGLFDQEPFNLAQEKIGKLLASGALEKRPNVNGQFAWGTKNKLGLHVESGIPVDLFETTEANWWVSLVVRTGSKETNLALTTGAQKLGRTLNAYGCGVTESDGTVIPATSEQHVFELCGVDYLEPNER